MLAALKILAHVASYRLRKLQMASLAATLSIALVLHLPWGEVFYRVLIVFGLNVLIYLNNDYLDVALDAQSSTKNTAHAQFLSDNKKVAWYTQWVLLATLVMLAMFLNWQLLAPVLCGAAACYLYSRYFKYCLYWDIAVTTLCGFLLSLCGTPLNNPLGLLMAVILALITGIFQFIQSACDADDDAAAGVRTTAVALGRHRSLFWIRILMTLIAVITALFLQVLIGFWMLVAVLVPCGSGAGGMMQYWTRIKLIYGLSWLGICWLLFQSGHAQGFLTLAVAAG